jgi:putative transferase (TIGR04331 family)
MAAGVTLAGAEAVSAFEDAYVEQAAREAGERVGLAEAAVLDRLPLASGGVAVAGWWCPPDSGSELIVLPNPWDERLAIGDHEAYCWGLSERVLERLAPALNGYHGVERGLAYWDLLLRPWLLLMLAGAIDRRLYCVALSRLCPELPVAAGSPIPVAATMGHAVELLRSDRGNRSLGSDLAGRLGLTLERRPQRDVEPRPAVPARSPLVGKAFTAAMLASDLVAGSVASLPRTQRVVLARSPHLSPADKLRLWARVPGLNIVPRPGSTAIEPGHAPASGLRDELAATPAEGDERAAALAAAVCRLLPRTVVEDYAAVVERSRSAYGADAPVLAGNYGAHDVENEFLARCAEAGRPLAFVQHGGTYMQARVNGQERLERRRGSTFVSWGARGDGVQPLPSPYLARLRDTHRGGSRVVIVEWIEPPDAYVLRFASTPLGNQSYRQSAVIPEFVRALRSVRQHLFLKRFPVPFAGVERAAEAEQLPHQPPALRRTAVRLMAASRMAVLPYPDTAFVEAMVLGVPLVGVWDPQLWEVRDDAQPVFDGLREAGVIFSEPSAAAAQVDDVYERADDWWASAEVRSARAAFLDHFAMAGDWLAGWAGFLGGLRR